MKIIALYLPQYHRIKENDQWWGNGYTEWMSLKKGKRIIEQQYQPRIPLNSNYYDLLDIKVMKWQVELAKKYNIYGFCVYHYWFNGHLLLEKPMENYLSHKEIDFPYFFCWANEKWTTVWEGDNNPRILMEQNYYVKADVDKHFYYLVQFFNDSRYMKIDNKPIINILNPISIPLNQLKYLHCRWNELARKEGYEGLYMLYQSEESFFLMNNEYRELFDKGIEYQPAYIDYEKDIDVEKKRYIKSHIKHWISNRFPVVEKAFFKYSKLIHDVNVKKLNSREYFNEKESKLIIKDYDEEWEKILSISHRDYKKVIPGGFVDWDNTPRRGMKGKVILGATPSKFEKYMEKLLERAKNLYSSDMVILFAWNEWSEGGYLEPDEKWGYGYLEAIKRAIEQKGETTQWNT